LTIWGLQPDQLGGAEDVSSAGFVVAEREFAG